MFCNILSYARNLFLNFSQSDDEENTDYDDDSEHEEGCCSLSTDESVIDEDDRNEMCCCKINEDETKNISVNHDIDADDTNTVYLGIEEADPLCVKLNELIRQGKIEKHHIFYKYINDVADSLNNPSRHQYCKESIEFINTISYLGGNRTACFLRGPMNLGEGRNSHHHNDKKLNLGGPSDKVRAKLQSGHTPDSGVIKSLSLANIKLMESDATPITDNDKLLVIPCAVGNDGTALKPAIEFDSSLNENVGLDRKVDIQYVNANASPAPEDLKKGIITETVVSSVTSLDNTTSLPCAVDYVPRAGKSGNAMCDYFESQVKILQKCKACQERSTAQRHILTADEIKCESYCEACYKSKSVCDYFASEGQLNYEPSLRFCTSCSNNKVKCVRRVVLILCGDCESGNKSAFDIIRERIEKESIDPYLSLLTVLPDCPHVGKSLKASFANWFLFGNGERMNIGLLRTLRNRSEDETKEKLRKLIPRNDHVKNKDRQDPSAVLTLCEKKLNEELRKVGYVSHTIIPELDKFTPDNKVGTYPSPISVAVASYGWIVFLSHDSKTGLNSLVNARLHSPVDKLTVLKKEYLQQTFK